MSARGAGPLAVALVHHTYGSPPSGEAEAVVREVAAGLRDLGHRPTILASHRARTRVSQEDGIRVVRLARLPEAPLRLRGFTGPLTHMPLTLRALVRGDYDIAHAFSAPDAEAALRWRRRAQRPVLFTCTEELDRGSLADSRLRLRLLGGAVEEADAVTAPTRAACVAILRWLAVDARVIAPRDPADHEELYRELLARPRPDRYTPAPSG